VIAWAFMTLVASTLLMLLVLVIRGPVRRAFGPRIAYALWALPTARMILPPLPESWRQGEPTPLAQATEHFVVLVADPIGLPVGAGEASGPLMWPWLLALWIIGALGFILYHLIAHRRFTRRVRRMARSVRRVAAGKVEVIETDAATGPLAFGVLRKYVAFPRDFAERYDPLERDLALAHELGHHARGDLVANWAALVVLALHWFNPVAWRAFRAFRADQELACDALVLAGRARELRQAYGRAIVKSAHGGAVSAACHLHTINELKGRLKMLNMHEQRSRSRLLAGSGAIVALLLAGLGMTASGTQAAERVRTKVETTIGVDLASIDVPVFPPIPALQDAPPPPPPPGAAPAPPAPPAPPPPPIAKVDDQDVKKRVRVMVLDRDGKHADGHGQPRRHFLLRRGEDGKLIERDFSELHDMPELAERLKNMPQFSSRDCRADEGKPGSFRYETREGDKRVIVICTNRIERHAEAAAARARSIDVVRIERHATASAIEGLRGARRAIESDRNLTEAQRSAALEGVEQALREMERKRGD
jgi:beta-lactamase regulating signal transducer with metallopeptidase domain